MKRTGFKPKPRKPLKRTPLRAKTALRTKHPLKRTTAPRRRKGGQSKISQKGYKVPSWFKSLKPGSHGQTIEQKKYWKVVSDTYRKEDFEKYGGKCVSCNFRLERWEDGQLAHYKAWSNCYGFFKYERKNMALSCARCNQNNDGFVAEAFKQELKRRHGEDIIEWIDKENLRHKDTKMEKWLIVDRTAKLLGIENALPF